MKLESCPFCLSSDLQVYTLDDSNGNALYQIAHKAHVECGVNMTNSSAYELVEKWNARPVQLESDADSKIVETMTIEIPKDYFNVAISTSNHLIANTNDSANWNTLKFPLPKGKWSILHIINSRVVVLGRIRE